MDVGQAERLIPMLEEMLAEAGLGWRDLFCLGVGTGPGNFTGVRISVAAARGLALGLGIPAVGVTALEALAYGRSGPRLVTLDARRGALYAQVFDGGHADICTLETLPETPPDPSCIGHRSAEVAARVAGHVEEPAFPQTVAMARIARSRRETAPRAAPFYLRAADAAPPSDPPPVILP
jgi:tRNA threonylcarbamoyl adenosine modification protein YeaZ